MLFFILIGAVAATGIYISVKFVFTSVVDTYYNSQEAKLLRQEDYISDLQNYITDNRISSEDTAEIAKWVRSNKYVYLLIYKDDELFFSDGGYGGEQQAPSPPFQGEGGITVDYPDREELEKYAAENGLHPLEMTDGVLLASFADFSEYLYYDIANIVSLVTAFVFLAAVMMLYFNDVTNRISNLGEDVTRVSDGDMNHRIEAEGKDELATLSGNVENMRISILENLKKEREARDANVELITSMSHDIRTPLTVLLGYLDIMKMRTEDKDMQGYLKASEATALRLKELSDDMFGYFLVFGQDAVPELCEYDAKTLVEQLFAEHILLLHEQGYRIELPQSNISLDNMYVTTDAPKTMRIVDNIFSNITKYADIQGDIEMDFSFVSESGEHMPVVNTLPEEKPRADRGIDSWLAHIFQKDGARAASPSDAESAEEPVPECHRGSLTVRVKNKIAERNSAESNRIGLKTCAKLADVMGLGFTSYEENDSFTVSLSLPAEIKPVSNGENGENSNASE